MSPPKYTGTPDTSRSDGLWVYDLTSYKSYFDPTFPGIWALWIQGTQYYRARYPNLIDPTNPIAGVGLDSREFIFVNPYSTPTDTKVGYEPVFSYVQPMPIGSLKSLSGNYWVNAVLRIRTDNWSYASRVVTSVDAASGKLNMNGSAAYSVGGNSGSSGFYIEHNRLEEVDSPGEYYYDNTTYRLYVAPMPGHSPADTMRFFPVKSSLPTDNWIRGYTLVIRASPISIDGLAVRYGFNGIIVSAPALVNVTHFDVSDILNIGLSGGANLVGCNFSDVGNTAADLKGAGEPRVTATGFRNIGMRDSGFMPCTPGAYYDCKYGMTSSVKCAGSCTVASSSFLNNRYATVWVTDRLTLLGNSMANNMIGHNDGATILFGPGSVMDGNVIVNIRGNNVSSPSLPVITTAFMGPLVNVTITNNVIHTGYVNSLLISLTCFRFFALAGASLIANTRIADNVCEGGRFDIEIDNTASVSGFALDRNTFSPTPGFPGPQYPVAFRFSNATSPRAYAETFRANRIRLQSIAGNTFSTNRTARMPAGVTALPNVSAAAWQPFYFGPFPPSPSARTNQDMALLADVSGNCKVVYQGESRDTSGACSVFSYASVDTSTSLSMGWTSNIPSSMQESATFSPILEISQASATNMLNSSSARAAHSPSLSTPVPDTSPPPVSALPHSSSVTGRRRWLAGSWTSA